MTDEEQLGRWFSEATKPQLAKYNQRMADAAPYRGAPRWERERDFASRHFRYETADARQLYERAMADLMALGEISEETDAMLTQFDVGQIFAQAAE